METRKVSFKKGKLRASRNRHELGISSWLDGILLMNVPFHYWIHEAPFDYYRYTRYALEYLSKKSGFELLEITEIGGALEVITDFLSKTLRNVPFIGPFFAMLLQHTEYMF